MPSISRIKSEVLSDRVTVPAMADLVFGLLPNSKRDDDYSEGLTNCALMAEFALLRWGGWTGQDYTMAVREQKYIELKRGATTFGVKRRDALLIELPGHNIAVFRDTKSGKWAGLHAWDGKFYLFPALNQLAIDHNTWNETEASMVKWIFSVMDKWGGLDDVNVPIKVRERPRRHGCLIS